MFKLFKRKNKMKELERRVLALESNITKLNSPKEDFIDFKKVWEGLPTLIWGNHNEKVNSPCFKCGEDGTLYGKGELIKGATISGAKINDLVATKAKVDELKKGAINVEKNSNFSTPTN